MRRASVPAALILPLLLALWSIAPCALAKPPAPEASGPRLALVIGNGAYKSAPLKNPANDARDMAAALKAVGFSVTLLTDAGHKQMEAAVREFGLALRQGGTGLFYFAGHGIQVGGENYLVPVDAMIQTESDVKFGCLSAGLVLGKMEDARNDLNIVVLDACRNNPFGRSFRSAEPGLAKMDAPAGSLIAYATAPGSVAADGAGRNGVYTENLLRHIRTPGLPISDVFMRTRIGVVAATGKKQVPWESSSLTGYFYFSGQGQAAAQLSDIKAEKDRVAEEAARLKREKEELAQLTALQAEKDRLAAERQRVEQAKLLAMAARPKDPPKESPRPGRPSAAHAAQLALLARSGLPEARTYFEQAVQLRPDDGEARAGLAISLVFSGREADAKYQVQRLDDAGAQGPAARLARGLLLGLAGNADSQYQFNRAQEEGADRALALLCQATAAGRRQEYERGLSFLVEYATLVPEAERGDYAKALSAKLDIVGRLVGTYEWVMTPGGASEGSLGQIRLTRDATGALVGVGLGIFSQAQTLLEEVQVKGLQLMFAFQRTILFRSHTYSVTCDISGDLQVIPITRMLVGGTVSNHSKSRLVRQAAAQP